MNRSRNYTVALIVTLMMILGSIGAVLAAEVLWYGGTSPDATWPGESDWIAVTGMEVDATGEINQKADLSDPRPAIAGRVDFTGNASNPQMYYYSTSSYIYFRLRVNDNEILADEYDDTIMILVDTDADDAGYDVPYAFGWDTRGAPESPPETQHGLEMLMIDGDLENGTVTVLTWYDLLFDDVDGQESAKITPYDFALTGGDGYIRTVDNVAGVAGFPTTSFVDFAISWDFLANSAIYVDGTNDIDLPLGKDQCWDIQVASMENENDHNQLFADVGGDQVVLDSISVTQGTGADPQLKISAADYPGEVCFSPTATQTTSYMGKQAVLPLVLLVAGLTGMLVVLRKRMGITLN